MRAVTLKQAKAHLNELVLAAARGDQVVLMRGSKHVAAIVPLTAEELELPPRLADAQAERLWQQIANDVEGGKTMTFAKTREAVAFIAGVRRASPLRHRGRPKR